MKRLLHHPIALMALILMVPGTALSVDKGAQDAYRIGAGDVLEISTWKEPDFSRPDIVVRLDGMISFPLLDDVKAKGLTPMELKTAIQNGLQNYIESPVVTVHVRTAASQRFYILGEVVKTGEYPLVKNLTVLQAFALAGGFTEWASKKEIILLRKENGENKSYQINYKEIARNRDLSGNLTLIADDTIIVP